MLGRLTDAASGYFDACLSPYWEAIRAQVHRDHVRRTAALAKGGWDAVFRTLHPSARWSFPVLELAYPVEQDLHLQGRGLVLQPSFFCRYGVTSLFDPLLPPVLVHPIDHDPAWARPARAPQAATALACLLGSTRAELLQAAADGPATTRELSRRIRTSSPNASRHLTALREAGLLRHHRHRNTVLHSVTDLGTALLNGRLPALPT
jgi:DNA-binding transcriptional ArsR family regulator